jgi:hypothetical protein
VGYVQFGWATGGGFSWALIAFVGLLVLRVYARDTKTIADATVVQAKDRVLPILALQVLPRTDGSDDKCWKFVNQGFGPAINLTFQRAGTDSPVTLAPVMQGGSFTITLHSSDEGIKVINQLKREEGFQVEYQSIVGERLRSTFRPKKDEGAFIEFENLSRPTTSHK